MARDGTLRVRIVGDTAPLEKSLGGLKRVGGVAVKALAGVGIAAGVAAAKGIADFAGFERQMNEVFTLLPGISDDAMAAMEGQVKDFSKEFGVLPNEVVPALYQSLSAGVPQDNVFEFLETAQQAAKGGVTDLTTAVDGISSVVNAYGDQISGATEASDLMFTAVRLGKTNFEELSASLSNVTPIASGLGVKFEDVSAGLATMTAKGVPTAQATTQLRSLFTELSKAGGEAATTFEEMAGKTFQEFIAEGGNTADALDIMGRAADENGVQLQDMFSSVEAGGAALSLASGDQFVDNLSEMGDAAGATEAAFETMDQGIGPVFDKLKARAAVALIDIGDKLAPVVEQVGNFILDHLPALQAKAAEVFGAVQATVERWWPTIVGAFDRVRSIVATVVEVVRSILDRFRGGLDENAGTVSGWSTTISTIFGQIRDTIAAVFGAIVAVIEAAVTIVTAFWDRFGQHIIDFTRRTFGRVLNIISGVLDVVMGIFKLVKAVLTGQWGEAWDAIKQIVAGAFRVVLNVIAQAFDHLKTVFGAAVAAISLVWSGLWAGIQAVVSATWDAIKGALSRALEFVTDLFLNFTGPGLLIKHWDSIREGIADVVQFFRDAWDGVIDFFAGLPDKIGRAAAGMWDGITDAFRSAINWIIDAWNGLEFRIPGFDPPGPGPTFGGFTLGVPDIRRLAGGGIVQARVGGMLANLGEGRHDEAVLPLSEAMFDRLGRAIARHMRGAGGVTQQFFGPVSDPVTGRAAALAIRMA